jgi:hypothetical protein
VGFAKIQQSGRRRISDVLELRTDFERHSGFDGFYFVAITDHQPVDCIIDFSSEDGIYYYARGRPGAIRNIFGRMHYD